MSFRLATAVFGVVSLAAVQVAGVAAQGEGPSRPQLPVSLSRIREALKKPENPLTSPQAKADFKVEIAEQQRFQDLVDLLDFSASPVVPAVLFGGSQTQPLVSVSLSGIGASVANSVAKARRARAERLAREEVERALSQFCASHECAAR
jgi:hypothetical protein